LPTKDEVVAALAPFARLVAEGGLADPEALQARLNAEHPVSGLGHVRALLLGARDEGWLTPKVASPTLTYGRVVRPTDELARCSIDAVDMSGAGAEHVHPNGEVSLCFATEGDPRFMGFPEGWVVVGRGSRHVPEVTGGRMVIVYFLPEGAMVWT
jgi:hypothetical protein